MSSMLKLCLENAFEVFVCFRTLELLRVVEEHEEVLVRLKARQERRCLKSKP